MHQKIKRWIDAENHVWAARRLAEVALENASGISPEFPLRNATSNDVISGNVFWYEDGDGGWHWKMICEVLHPDDKWKAFCSHDGCRYGLDGAMVETSTPN